MVIQFRMPCYILMAALLVMAGGCAPTTTKQPDLILPGTSVGSQPSGSQAGEGQRGATRESTADTSSLKQLQEGKPPATPASSPLKDIFFDFDRADLRPDARETLRANADWLKLNPAVRIEIEGHCDERGTNEYNLALGARRAQAAKDYLVTLGILSERLSTISYGEEVPVCKEQNENCWRQNRRARFVISPTRPTS
ncbi:MAG: peptidoglycan-associated lipoprotein Pal [Deltaproteobacteria bacterium]|nr:peptidoglycan-associated lipoprotein Pal [Deltaproteobacteria bacterium]